MRQPEGPAAPAVIALTGTIEYSNAREIHDRLTAALDRAPATLIIDLSATTFCDTAAFAELAKAHKLATDRGLRLCLVVPPGPLTRLFALHGLDDIWSIHPTRHAALTASAVPQDPLPAS